MESLKSIIPVIHKEGYYFIIIFAVISLIIATVNSGLGWVGAILTIWCVFFFRNPDRITPVGDNFVVSPADGVVQLITNVPPPPELNLGDEARVRISIFLNVFDVHVNRVPTSGTITKLLYHPGKFVNASLDKASVHNERQNVVMYTAHGNKEIIFTQIAGLVARRIVCNLEDGDQVKAGERFGIIRFGSRMDIYLPAGTIPLVMVGQRAVGGETILADLDYGGPIREGETR